MSNLINTIDCFFSVIIELNLINIQQDLEHRYNDLNINFNIPEEIHRYFIHFKEEINIETGYSSLNLFSLNELKVKQDAYLPPISNNLWSYFKAGHQLSCIAIAEKDDDPIIIDITNEGYPVYASYESGDFIKIANTFYDFLLALTEAIKIIYNEFNVYDIKGEEFDIKQEFCSRIEEVILPILGIDNYKSFFAYMYG